MRNSASPWAGGYTGRDYRRGLPKGTPDRVGDIFIDRERGTAYQLVNGPRGDKRLRNLANGLERVASGWEDTNAMAHVKPGETFELGGHEWKVIAVNDKRIEIVNEQGEPREEIPGALAKQIQEEREAHVRADEERRRTRAERRDAVSLMLNDAGVKFVTVTYDVDEKRGGIVVKGIENREALPDTLVILAEQDDAIIVGLKSEIEQALDAKADEVLDEVGVPDLAADEALKIDVKVLNRDWFDWLKRHDALLKPEPKKSRVELRTVVHVYEDGEGFSDYTVPDGWEIEDVQYQLFPLPGSPAWQSSHIRYITLTRVVTE